MTMTEMTQATSPAPEWTLQRVLALSYDEQLELFATLPPAELSELDGEYLGHPGGAHSEKADAAQHASLYNEDSPFGYWLGKAFKVTSAGEAEGYNHCRKSGGRVVRHLRFGARLGVSYLDGKPSYLLTYASFKNRSGAADLTDEVRRVASGLYLGTATVLAKDGGRSKPSIFLLSGPVGAWVGPDDPSRELK